MNEFLPKRKRPIKIEIEDPQNIFCPRCECWMWRGWADKQTDGSWLCHDCQEEISTGNGGVAV